MNDGPVPYGFIPVDRFSLLSPEHIRLGYVSKY